MRNEQEKKNRLIRDLRHSIIATVMLIGDCEDLMEVYATAVDLLYMGKAASENGVSESAAEVDVNNLL